MHNFALSPIEHTIKQVTLQVSDEKGNHLTGKISSQLNVVSRNLKSGSIIEIEKFQVLK